MKRTKPSKNKRTLRPRILILCEGETEANYFRAIKQDPEYKQILSAIDPQITEAKKPAPELIVKEAIKKFTEAKKENNPYNKVWLVFDHDNSARRQQAYDLAKSQAFDVAFSAIAFEKWFLLHFIFTTRAFSSAQELIKELKNHYPTYEKAKQNDFENLKHLLANAKQHALLLRDQVSDPSIHLMDHNPWVDVDILVDELIGSSN